jgi:UDP-N-acetylmuramoylalanine--D-glutamate ligase
MAMKTWLEYDRYAVLGVARSGVAAANLLARRGKQVVASDIRPIEELGEAIEQLDDAVEVVGGENVVGDAEVVVVSPGLKPGLELFSTLRARSIPFISEVELGFAATDTPILAITGTDGKSTTTVLTHHILESAGVAHRVGGNLGTPLCALVDEPAPGQCIVVEVSANQLWTCHRFSPQAFGLTNIASDHLDYFESQADYVAAKRRVMQNAAPDTWGVFNAEDRCLREWLEGFEGRALAYGLSEEVVSEHADALWLDAGGVSARLDGREHRGWIESTAELPLVGDHNLLNLMCAAGLALSVGVDLAQIAAAVDDFEPLAHRLEYCGEVDGVHFYDDSKATNVNAALAGLRSLEGRIVPIIGGLDKGLDIGELVSFVVERGAPVVLLGEIRQRLGTELRAAGHRESHIHPVDSLEEAVGLAYQLARPDGTVSLSPACSSFDMFDSYKQRGELFQQFVADLD